MWKDYYAKVDAIVFLVAAVDKERFMESKKELDSLLGDESLGNVPFLILGNKIGVPHAASEEELRHCLGLTNYTTGKGKVNLENTNMRPIEVFMCSVVRRMGSVRSSIAHARRASSKSDRWTCVPEEHFGPTSRSSQATPIFPITRLNDNRAITQRIP